MPVVQIEPEDAFDDDFRTWGGHDNDDDDNDDDDKDDEDEDDEDEDEGVERNAGRIVPHFSPGRQLAQEIVPQAPPETLAQQQATRIKQQATEIKKHLKEIGELRRQSKRLAKQLKTATKANTKAEKNGYRKRSAKRVVRAASRYADNDDEKIMGSFFLRLSSTMVQYCTYVFNRAMDIAKASGGEVPVFKDMYYVYNGSTYRVGRKQQPAQPQTRATGVYSNRIDAAPDGAIGIQLDDYDDVLREGDVDGVRYKINAPLQNAPLQNRPDDLFEFNYEADGEEPNEDCGKVYKPQFMRTEKYNFVVFTQQNNKLKNFFSDALTFPEAKNAKRTRRARQERLRSELPAVEV